ncbi:hypothetical protein LCGC14_2513540, partial [marine sediment metagenome]
MEPEALTETEQKHMDTQGESSLGGVEPDENAKITPEPVKEPEPEEPDTSPEIPDPEPQIETEAPLEADSDDPKPEPEPEKPKREPTSSERRFEKLVQERKQFSVELAQERQERAKLEGRIDQILKSADAPPPDPEEDPEAFNTHQLAQKDAQIADLQKQADQFNQQQALNAEVQEVQKVLADQIAEADNPEFDAMQNHLLESRRAELVNLMGVNATSQDVQNQLQQEVWNELRAAHQKGYNIPAYVEQLARQRGYGNGVTAGSNHAPPASQTDQADKKLATIAKGQEAGSKMSSGGGPSGKGLTLNALAAMS